MPARLAALLDERRKLERELTDAKKKLAMGGGAKAGGEPNGVRMVGDVKLMARAVEGIDIKDLKSLADEGKKQLGSGVVALVGVTEDGKAGIVVGVTSDLTARFSAVDLVRKGAEALGGKGRRAARHGAGRRPRRRQGRCGARGDRCRARWMMPRASRRPLRRMRRGSRAASAFMHDTFRALADRSAVERAEGNRRRFRGAARSTRPDLHRRAVAQLIGSVFCRPKRRCALHRPPRGAPASGAGAVSRARWSMPRRPRRRRIGAKRITLGARIALPSNLALFRRHGFVVVGYETHAGFSAPTSYDMELRLG